MVRELRERLVLEVGAPPPKNVEQVILQYVDRFLAEFFLLLTYTNR